MIALASGTQLVTAKEGSEWSGASSDHGMRLGIRRRAFSDSAHGTVESPVSAIASAFPARLLEMQEASTGQVLAVLGGLVLFLAIYLGLMLLPFLLAAALLIFQVKFPFAAIILAAIIPSGLFSLVLIWGLVGTGSKNPAMRVEIDERSQPVFFAFLRRLTEEIGAPMPHRVFLTPEINAAMAPEVTLINLILPPKKNLIVGSGLINALNLSEFKAVMGHEFGHFSQKVNRLHHHVYIASARLTIFLTGTNWSSSLLAAAASGRSEPSDDGAPVVWFLALAIGGPIWIIRVIMSELFHLLTLASNSMSRRLEFHADRVGVSVAGSNAMVHGLYRLDFAEKSLEQAIMDLERASQHRLYSRDLYFHHRTAAERIRRQEKKPHLGVPAALTGPHDGEDLRLSDPDDDDPVPAMYATHPKNFAREESAKEVFVPAEIDERSPWILFEDPAYLANALPTSFTGITDESTVPKESRELSPAEKVQEFIDEEFKEITYDPKYHGAYDERVIQPGDILELNRQFENEPWPPGRIERVHPRLYLELGNKVDELAEAGRRSASSTVARMDGPRRRIPTSSSDSKKTLKTWANGSHLSIEKCTCCMRRWPGALAESACAN